MKRIFKSKNYILAFIIPLVLSVAIFYSKGILTNIEEMYVSDLRLQHLPFLNYFKNILLGRASLLYSFSAGMGNQMLSTIIFYCLSPINILLLIVEDIRYAILYIYFIKISLSGLTMFILLKNKHGKDDFATVLFSTCYAVSGFVIYYFFAVFWFDSLYLAPLVMLGIDRIFKYEKISFLYIVSLSLAIICNIQMGFGLCIFSALYFLYSYNIQYDFKKNQKKFKDLAILFTIASLCVGAISSGALFGFATDYGTIGKARSLQVTTVTGISNITHILKNIFTVGNLKSDYYNELEPFIYCGLIVSFFSIMYLFDKNIDKKKRINAFLMILVFVISFCVRFINTFWHITSPVLLNYRYSIYLGLFLTMIAHECFIQDKKLSSNNILIMSLSLLVGLTMIMAYSKEVYVLYAFGFIIVIFTLIILTKNKSKKFGILLSIAVIAEILVNGYTSVYTADELPYGKYSSYDDLKEIASYNDFDDNYRIMYNYSYTDFTNDTFLLNKNSSIRYFSSIINGDVLTFFDRNKSTVGNNNYRISAYDTPLLISLLGNKYFYLTDDLHNGLYKKIDSYKIKSYNYTTSMDETKNVYLFENPYALSLGYMIESDAKYKKGMDLIDYQNAIIKAFTGNDKDVTIRLDYEKDAKSEECANSSFYSCATYHIKNDTGNQQTYLYALFDSYSVKNQSTVYLDILRPMIISTLDKNITISLEYSQMLVDEDFAVATYNKNNLVEDLTKLQENMLENIKINKNKLTASINASKDGILFLSIPYSDNFEISVDGKKIKYYSLLDDAFVGLDITKGEHNISIKYVDNKVSIYVAMSTISLIITIILGITINKRIDKKKQEEERIKQEMQEKIAKNRAKKEEKNKKSNQTKKKKK